MLRRRIPGRIRLVALAHCRGFAVLAIAAKLAVPVGYMPAALADGGPLALCGSGMPAALAAHHDHASSGHGHGAPVHNSSATGHGEPTSGNGQSEDPASAHTEWERCSLGGLASLAAMATEWRLQFAIVPAGRIALTLNSYALPGATLAFRSRAPPISIS